MTIMMPNPFSSFPSVTNPVGVPVANMCQCGVVYMLNRKNKNAICMKMCVCVCVCPQVSASVSVSHVQTSLIYQ